MKKSKQIRKEIIERTDSLKLDLVENIMRVFKAYKLTINTLFLTISMLNRVYAYLAKGEKLFASLNQFSENEKMKLAALICISLASKYQERIAFKLSALVKSLRIIDKELTNEEEMRMMEFEILRILEFRIGGD